MDKMTQEAFDHICRNGVRYKREFVFRNFVTGQDEIRLIQTIKEVRSEVGCGLKEAKDAVEAWRDQRFPVVEMSMAEAKILLRNLMVRGTNSLGLTPLEVGAIERLIK